MIKSMHDLCSRRSGERIASALTSGGPPMRAVHVALIAAFWCLSGPASAQKADVEIGILSCMLEEPSNALDITGPVRKPGSRRSLYLQTKEWHRRIVRRNRP